MDRETVRIKIVNIVRGQLDIGWEKIKPTSNLRTSLGADTLDVIEMVMDAEEIFGVDVELEELKEVNTVSDLCDLICNKIGGT